LCWIDISKRMEVKAIDVPLMHTMENTRIWVERRETLERAGREKICEAKNSVSTIKECNGMLHSVAQIVTSVSVPMVFEYPIQPGAGYLQNPCSFHLVATYVGKNSFDIRELNFRKRCVVKRNE
jgi:hypothetical protein